MNLNYEEFLDKIFEDIKEKGIDLSSAKLDHIAYQASSKEDYQKYSEIFKKFAQLVKEPIVNGRRVGVFKFFIPLKYNDQSIEAIELIEPKEGQVAPSALEHAEFILDESLEEFMDKYPDLDWDTSSLNRDEFQHLKLKLSENTQVKFPRKSLLGN